uniref:Uncharacterized protein n=1 Tax=Nelumbo nucifera TaxID=4432 RepID=A0A822XHJ5_NELNU|nr:TPA_asm: hypothetical protein HUJ06_020074 [Nelumbo nucifera]
MIFLVIHFPWQVVLLNQVTTKFNEGSYQLTLALGNCILYFLLIS